MVSSTRGSQRARNPQRTPPGVGRGSTRIQTTSRLPAAIDVSKPRKSRATSVAKNVGFDDGRPSFLVRAWLALAHIPGGAARLLGKESLAKDERRDGVPFFILLLAIAGAAIEWFFPSDSVAVALDAYSFGGLFGRVAFALPVIMLLFAIWLFRHPASVHDNGRIGIGLTVLLASISGLCHIFGGQPQPVEGMPGMAAAGGVLGWVLAAPLILVITPVFATAVVILLLILSLFIITKTQPNRLGQRLHELYAYLFGVPLPDEQAQSAASADSASSSGSSWASGLADLGLGS